MVAHCPFAVGNATGVSRTYRHESLGAAAAWVNRKVVYGTVSRHLEAKMSYFGFANRPYRQAGVGWLIEFVMRPQRQGLGGPTLVHHYVGWPQSRVAGSRMYAGAILSLLRLLSVFASRLHIRCTVLGGYALCGSTRVVSCGALRVSGRKSWTDEC